MVVLGRSFCSRSGSSGGGGGGGGDGGNSGSDRSVSRSINIVLSSIF